MAVHALLARLRQPSITLYRHLLLHAALKNVVPAFDDQFGVLCKMVSRWNLQVSLARSSISNMQHGPDVFLRRILERRV